MTMRHIRERVDENKQEKQYTVEDSLGNRPKSYRALCGVYVPTNLLNQHYPYAAVERLRTLGLLTPPSVYPYFCPACLWEYGNAIADETASS